MAAETVTKNAVALAEKVFTSAPEAEKPAAVEAEKPVAQAAKPSEVVEVEADKITQQVSFTEETNVVSELPESHRKALEELKKLIQEACAKREFSTPPPPPPVKQVEEKKAEEVAEKKEEEQTPKPAEVAPPPATVVAAPPAATTVAKEPPQTQEAPKNKEPPTKVVEAPKKEKEDEKTVESIKETIVEEVAAKVTTPMAEADSASAVAEPVEPEEVSIWGVPLLADERSDVILLKFLRARDMKVKEAFTMIRNAARWRKEFGIDELVQQHDLGSDYDKIFFSHGYDKQGRPVVYNVFGEIQNKDLYETTFSDAEKRAKFEKSLFVFLEKFVRALDFSPKGINTFVLVNDLKNTLGYAYGKKDVKQIIDKFLLILQDNYPEFIAKQVCINTSWWYLAYYWIYVTVFTPRSKSKFVFASPSKTPETLFKYISPEHVPVQYGGHSKIGEIEFSSADLVTEVTIKPGTKYSIELASPQATELVWELRVIGWDVSYDAEFHPSKEGGYTLNIAKPKKITATDEPLISQTFKATEPGKVVITIDNQSSKKKKLFYRFKVKA